ALRSGRSRLHEWKRADARQWSPPALLESESEARGGIEEGARTGESPQRARMRAGDPRALRAKSWLATLRASPSPAGRGAFGFTAMTCRSRRPLAPHGGNANNVGIAGRRRLRRDGRRDVNLCGR